MREQALERLREVFGYGEFRGHQADIIDQVAQVSTGSTQLSQ